jgi:hypothetical protein
MIATKKFKFKFKETKKLNKEFVTLTSNLIKDKKIQISFYVNFIEYELSNEFKKISSK